MKEFIDVVDGAGRVLVRQSEAGEPLFVGVFKLGPRHHYGRYVSIAGTSIIIGGLIYLGVL